MVALKGVVNRLVGVLGSSLKRLALGTSCIVGCVARVGCFVVGHVEGVVVGCAFGSSVCHSYCRSCVVVGFGNHKGCTASSSWLVVRTDNCFGMSGDFLGFVVSVVVGVVLQVGGMFCVG